MFVICRSPKGGVGTSVVAAALALRHAHAAREGVRVAATGGDHGEVTEAVVASGRLPPQRLEVEVVPGGGRVTVVVCFDAPTNVPIVGALVGDLAPDAEATMRLER